MKEWDVVFDILDLLDTGNTLDGVDGVESKNSFVSSGREFGDPRSIEDPPVLVLNIYLQLNVI